VVYSESSGVVSFSACYISVTEPGSSAQAFTHAYAGCLTS